MHHMPSELDSFILRAQQIAIDHQLDWEVPYDLEDGRIPRESWWDLRAAAKHGAGERAFLSTFGTLGSGAAALQTLSGEVMPAVMGRDWIELYKALLLHDLFVKRNKPRNGISNLGNPFRLLAGCVGSASPSQITSDQVRLAYNVGLMASTSGQWARLLKGMISGWFDAFQLAERRPLAQYCSAYPDRALVQEQEAKLVQVARRQIDTKRPDSLRSKLSIRHFEDKLPEQEDLAELVRIVFSETPRTTSDFIRFHQARLLIVTGFRVGELILLPEKTLVNRNDTPPHPRIYGPPEPGTGLLHFAEKQHQDGPGQEFVEALHHAPSLLAPIVRESVAAVLRATAPQRLMLQRQHAEQRLFVGLSNDDLLPWAEAYRRMSGIMQTSQEPIPADLRSKYRSNYDPAILNEMRDHQDHHVHQSGEHKQVREYFRRMEAALQRPILRRSRGELFSFALRERNDGRGVYIRAGDMEVYARDHLQLKLPDERVVQFGEKDLRSDAFLFLLPGKIIAEEKYDAIVDIDRYFSVKRADKADLELQLGGKNPGLIFKKYGKSEQARSFSVNPHSLRHFQTTEMFKLGVADTIITKRFNRTSVAQSYTYDHRSVSERLEEMEPGQSRLADEMLGPKARKAFDLIRSRKIQGPVVKRFLELQTIMGDEAAFEYLNAEAGSLHITPYGFCLNSFAASPCLKHLECFNSCSHLVRTDAAAEQDNLQTLKRRFEVHIDRLRQTGSRAPHFQTQMQHAESRLAGVNAALDAAPGEKVFPSSNSRYLPPE